MDFRVASNLASFSATGDETPGRPESSLFQLRLPMSPRVAPATASSGFAGDGSSSCLEFRVLRRFRRLSLGLPLSFALQQRLPVWLRVAPHPASSGFAGDGSSSRPEFRILQRIWRLSSRLPHSLAVPVTPTDESPSCPGVCIFRPCRRWIFESPRISHPSAHPAPKLRASP
jgi:hypothetical protein